MSLSRHRRLFGETAGPVRRSAVMATVLALLTSLLSLAIFVPGGLPLPKAYGAIFQPSGLETNFFIPGPGTPLHNNANKSTTTSAQSVNWDNIFTPTLSLGSQQTPTFVPSAPYTTPGSAPTGGFKSSGIFNGTFFWDDGDPNNCSGTTRDPTANQTNQTINSNPWVPAPANVQDKANLCSSAYAMEALSDSTGLRHFLLYGYFTRATGNGSVSIDTVFQSPAAGRCGDLMLDMQFPEGTAQFLDWHPTSGDCSNPNGAGLWVPSGRTVDFTFATGVRTEGPVISNQQQNTFMEFGIDLTSAGLFGDSQCSTFTLSQTMSRTGSASSLSTASVADFLINPNPLSISNCGTLSVTKKTPTGTTSDEFGFTVTNDSSMHVVIPPDQKSITGTLKSGETKTFDNVLSSSLLHLNETTIPPPWQKQLVQCSFTDAVGVVHTTTVTNGEPFTLIGGSRTDCVITDNAALVTVKKLTKPEFSPEKFDFVLTGSNGDVLARTTLGNTNSATFAVPVAGTPTEPITITEDVPGGWQTPSVECDTVPSHTADSVDVVPVLGENITCTYTNTQLATVTIVKRVPEVAAGDVFTFRTDLGTSPFQLKPEPSGQVNGGFATDERTFEVVPRTAPYTVNEVLPLPPGFVLADRFCFDSAYGTENLNFTGSIDVLPGSQITCTFTDTKGGTLIVDKATEPAVEFDQNFEFHVSGEAELSPSSFTLNTIGNDFAQLFTDVPDGDYTISETVPAGWTNSDVLCIDTTTNPPTVLHTGEPEPEGEVTIHVGANDVVRCTYTDTAAPAELALQKTVENVGQNLSWDFNLSLSPGTDTSASDAILSGTGPGSPPTAQHSWSDLVPGQTYVLSETAVPGWIMGEITCEDLTGPVVNEDKTGATFTFTAKVGQELSCILTNRGKPSAITVTKIVAGIDGSEMWSFDLTISPPATGDNPQTASGTGLGTSEISWSALVPGQRYTITDPLPAYVTQTLTDCAGATPLEGGGLTFVAPLDETVTCTLTNLVAPVVATLAKASNLDGAFTFVLHNLDTDALDIDIPVTTSGGTGSQVFSLTAGTRYSLHEASPPPAGFIGGTLICTMTPAGGGTPVVLDLTEFTVPAGSHVACDVSNRSTHTVTLQKAWVNAAAGDTARLSINGATGSAGFSTSTASGAIGTEQDTSNRATDTITADEQVTVAETLPTGNTGTYTTILKCISAGSDVTLTRLSDANRTGTFTMPAAAVTCEFLNVRTTHHLTLVKFWNNGATGDTATLTISPAIPPVSVTATVPAGGTGPSGEVATENPSGTAVTVSESLPAAGQTNTGTYTTTLVCTTGGTTVEVDLTDANRTGMFTMPPGATACVFTNSRTTHSVTVRKNWVNAAAGDTAELSINAAATGPGFAVATVPAGGAGTSTEVATDDTIASGTEVSVTELLPTANVGTYTTELACSDSAGIFTVDLTDANRAGAFTMPADEVNCAFLNTGLEPTTITTEPAPAPPAPPDRLPLGTAVHDTATVTSASTLTATGRVTFELFGPNDSTCSGTPAFAPDPVALEPNGTATSPSFTPTAAGTYQWVAVFTSATPGLDGSTSGCGLEPVDIGEVPSTISTAPMPPTPAGGLPAGTAVHDTATVTGTPTLTPAGSVTFELFSNDACSGSPVFSDANVPLSSSSPFTATSGSFTLTVPGTYQWVAVFNSETPDLGGTSSGCGQEPVDIAEVPATMTTAPMPPTPEGGLPAGTAVHDTATVAGTPALTPTGSVTFELFNNEACSGTPVFREANVALSGGAAMSASFTPTTPGTYQWVAVFNSETPGLGGTSSACGEEPVVIAEVSATIRTSPMPPTPEGGLPAGVTVHDTATVTGTPTLTPTGSVTFELFSNDACSGNPVFSDVNVPLSTTSPFTATSGSVTLTVPGTYQWVAVFSSATGGLGGTSSACGEEPVVIAEVSSSIQTGPMPPVPPGGLPLGTVVHDTATVTGTPTLTPAGSVTFELFSNDACSGNPVFADPDVPLSGGTATSGSVPLPTAGTYQWVAVFTSTTPGLAGSTSGCGLEPVVITEFSSSIQTGPMPPAPPEGLPLGTEVHDTATVAGSNGLMPTGTVTFELFNNSSCSGAPVFSDPDVALSSTSPFTATSATVRLDAAGTYQWVAVFTSTITGLAGSTSACGLEPVDIAEFSPSITTIPMPPAPLDGLPLGTAIHDTAMVTGASTLTPTGSVTFELFSNDACSGNPVFADPDVPLSGGAATSGSFTPAQAGTYQWVAVFTSTTAGLAGTSSGCGLEPVDIADFSSSVTTTPSPASGPVGGEFADSATVTGPGGLAPTGSVTFKLFNNSTCAGSPVFTDPDVPLSGGTASSASFAPTTPGTYYWVAEFTSTTTGLAGNTSECPGEPVQVGEAAAASVATTPSPASGPVGGKFSDSATVTGSDGLVPAGSVTFELFAPANDACNGAPVFTSTVTLSAAGTATSAMFTATTAGTYNWVAVFNSETSGLGGNSSACGAEPITVTTGVAPPSPPIAPSPLPVTG